MHAWKRTYWVVFLSNLITAMGMMSFLPFFPTLLEEMGVTDVAGRATWSGLLFGAAPLSAALMGPVWGSIGDRFGRKLMVVRALLAITVFVGAMGFATTPWHLLFLRLGQGIFSGFVPPSLTLVSVLAPKQMQGRITGSLQAALPAGMVTGPLVGAAIQSVWGMQGVFVFVALASGFSALLVALLAREDPRLRASYERFSPTSLLAGAAGDLAGLFAIRPLRLAVAALFLVQFGLGATNPVLQLYVEDVWRGDPARVEVLTASLFSAFALTAILATTLWGRVGDRIGHGRTLALSSLASAGVLGLLAAAPAYAWLLAGRVALGLATPGTNAAAFGIAATETPPQRRGSALGAVFSARALAVSLGAMSGGALSSWLGIRGLFVAAGVVIALGLGALRWRGAGNRVAVPD